MSDWDNVNKVWPAVEKDMPNVGATILLRLFKEHAETQSLFPKFKNMSLEQLMNCEDVRKQGAVVLRALGNMVKKKGNHASNVKELADTHINKHKIPPQNFTLITDIAVNVLTEIYPSEMTAQARESFSKVFAIICADIEKLYKEANFQG
ncbi:myoglobin [Heptranchias perlo]|uniref:myoglobin n=1 Tax=Heptranchias perlo TaxID=212740 RepID=UPI00355A4ECE